MSFFLDFTRECVMSKKDRVLKNEAVFLTSSSVQKVNLWQGLQISYFDCCLCLNPISFLPISLNPSLDDVKLSHER